MPAIVSFSALGDPKSAYSLAPTIGRLLNSGGISDPISGLVFYAFVIITLGTYPADDLFIFYRFISTFLAKAFIAA